MFLRLSESIEELKKTLEHNMPPYAYERQSIFGQHKYIVPDVIEPIVGYRAWRIMVGTPLIESTLHSTTYRYNKWIPGETIKAVCGYDHTENNKRCSLRKSLHHPPHKGGACGFYAYKEPDWRGIRGKVQAYYSIVLGEVELWGKIVEHEIGYRAQYARVKKLVQMVRTDDILFQAVSERYNIYD